MISTIKEFFYSIPDWVWLILIAAFFVKWILNIIIAPLELISNQLNRIDGNFGAVRDKLEDIEKHLSKLDDIERYSRNLDLLSNLDKIDNLDELDWWSKDKITFATQLFDILEKIGQKE